MSTATLEFLIQTRRGLRSGMADYHPGCPNPMGFPTIHARHVLADHLDPLPLCWVAEGKSRPVPATVEDWEVSFDHETLPDYAVIDVNAFVSCPACKEQIHA